MSSWPQVREELIRLQAEHPDVLLGYTSPEADPEPDPPFTIRLAATALPVAEELHRRFGTDVKLRVGALPFPPGPAEPWELPSLREPVSLDHQLEGIRVELDGPLAVHAGEAAEHGLLIFNDTAAALTLRTNGHLSARIVDLNDGSHVGGDTRPARMPLVQFLVAPGQSTRVPLIVATTSFVSRLGYAIPPGRWGITVDLDFGYPAKLRAPVVQFDVLPAA